MSLRLSLPLLLVLSALLPVARADVLDAMNWARLHGCRPRAARTVLRIDPRLQNAARRLAAGSGLHQALAVQGYLASQSAALHLSGAVDDAQIARAITADYCATLTDPALRAVGTERRGRDVWIVMAAPVPMPAAADAAAVSLSILKRVNSARAAGRRCGARYYAPAPPLQLNAQLAAAALEHSRDMARHGEFDHRGHDGSTPSLRVRRAGFGAFRLVGENIAAGAMTAREVTDGWLASPAHCENIMDARFTAVGVGYAANLDTAAGLYWTQDFAAR